MASYVSRLLLSRRMWQILAHLTWVLASAELTFLFLEYPIGDYGSGAVEKLLSFLGLVTLIAGLLVVDIQAWRNRRHITTESTAPKLIGYVVLTCAGLLFLALSFPIARPLHQEDIKQALLGAKPFSRCIWRPFPIFPISYSATRSEREFCVTVGLIAKSDISPCVSFLHDPSFCVGKYAVDVQKSTEACSLLSDYGIGREGYDACVTEVNRIERTLRPNRSCADTNNTAVGFASCLWNLDQHDEENGTLRWGGMNVQIRSENEARFCERYGTTDVVSGSKDCSYCSALPNENDRTSCAELAQRLALSETEEANQQLPRWSSCIDLTVYGSCEAYCASINRVCTAPRYGSTTLGPEPPSLIYDSIDDCRTNDHGWLGQSCQTSTSEDKLGIRSRCSCQPT